MFQILRFLALIALPIIILPACSTLAIDVPFVYEIDVDQGNVIDQDMINQLRPGMTKRQVIYVLGSPLMIDPFTTDRWDYIYSQHPGSEDRFQQRIALFFNGDVFVRGGGDLTPEENPGPPPSKEMTVNVPKRVLDKTLYEIITGWFIWADEDEEFIYDEDKGTEYQNDVFQQEQDQGLVIQ
ncbi:MAG: outer membrane protein assembly factor BamE [Methyloprofundus sp.]|nr:outer membrane protein assembly factor BamE [Methyloprofundus sp.]